MRGPHRDELAPILTGPEICTACRRACSATRTGPCSSDAVTRALGATTAVVSMRLGRPRSARVSSSFSLSFPKADDLIAEGVVVRGCGEVAGERRPDAVAVEAAGCQGVRHRFGRLVGGDRGRKHDACLIIDDLRDAMDAARHNGDAV